MARAWTLGGLSVPELLRRTWLESWHDAVYGQAGRMAFYHFLALFPTLLIFLSLTSSVPSVGPGVKNSAMGVVQQVLPNAAAGLVQQMAMELGAKSPAGAGLLVACAGALWAAMNGTWALIYGMNAAYEVKENRSWWELGLTIGGLTLSLTVLGSLALLILFCATLVEAHFFHGPPLAAVRATQWFVVLGLLMTAFAIIYRFAPNLKEAKWRWSTPGSLCAALLWLVSTFSLSFYFAHISDYTRAYGHLNTVVMLLLWFYFSNAAILIGGEMNSVIEQCAENTGGHDRSGN